MIKTWCRKKVNEQDVLYSRSPIIVNVAMLFLANGERGKYPLRDGIVQLIWKSKRFGSEEAWL